jgi:hypothetical protein
MPVCDNCQTQKRVLIPVEKGEAAGEGYKTLKWCLHCIRNESIE